MRVCAGGDVTLGVNGDTITRKGKTVRPRVWPAPDSLLAPIAPLFADADVVLLNLEGAIGDGPASKCAKASKTCYGLRMPAAAAPAVRAINARAVVVGNVANNHAHDAGDDGFAETRRRLDSAGVLVTGADSDATIVVTARGRHGRGARLRGVVSDGCARPRARAPLRRARGGDRRRAWW